MVFLGILAVIGLIQIHVYEEYCESKSGKTMRIRADPDPQHCIKVEEAWTQHLLQLTLFSHKIECTVIIKAQENCIVLYIFSVFRICVYSQ
jgi:hypothetical protein